MSSPKKKLPTGPIRIDTHVSKLSPSSSKETLAQATQTALEKELAGEIPETRKQDSSFIEDNIPETGMLVSGSQDSEFPDLHIVESTSEDSTRPVEFPDVESLESGIPESSLGEQEYKKVAMRLSAKAVESLRQLRATTGVPYEILVDVMICNWDKLPAGTRAAYLEQAKQVRIERLIAGQEKTMKTMRSKYLK